MTFKQKLLSAADRNASWLCVGLDLDPERIPAAYGTRPSGLEDYAKEVIAATSDLVCAYKPNIAFFEALGIPGLEALARIIAAVPKDIPVILDAKRADIGNTSARYAKAAFEILAADAVTVSPYMGFDSLEPFFRYEDRHTFVLVLTSNPGSADFEQLDAGGEPLYLRVARKVREWNTRGNVGAVVGATRPEGIRSVRNILTDEIFLIPGIGTQGGDATASAGFAFSGNGKAVFNVSRDVLFAGSMDQVRRKADEYRKMIGPHRAAGAV